MRVACQLFIFFIGLVSNAIASVHIPRCTVQHEMTVDGLDAKNVFVISKDGKTKKSYLRTIFQKRFGKADPGRQVKVCDHELKGEKK